MTVKIVQEPCQEAGVVEEKGAVGVICFKCGARIIKAPGETSRAFNRRFYTTHLSLHFPPRDIRALQAAKDQKSDERERMIAAIIALGDWGAVYPWWGAFLQARRSKRLRRAAEVWQEELHLGAAGLGQAGALAIRTRMLLAGVEGKGL